MPYSTCGVYRFLFNCGEVQVGEMYNTMSTRIKEHRGPQKSTQRIWQKYSVENKPQSNIYKYDFIVIAKLFYTDFQKINTNYKEYRIFNRDNRFKL